MRVRLHGVGQQSLPGLMYTGGGAELILVWLQHIWCSSYSFKRKAKYQWFNSRFRKEFFFRNIIRRNIYAEFKTTFHSVNCNVKFLKEEPNTSIFGGKFQTRQITRIIKETSQRRTAAIIKFSLTIFFMSFTYKSVIKYRTWGGRLCRRDIKQYKYFQIIGNPRERLKRRRDNFRMCFRYIYSQGNKIKGIHSQNGGRQECFQNFNRQTYRKKTSRLPPYIGEHYYNYLKDLDVSTRNWVNSAQDKSYLGALVNAGLNLWVP